MYHRTVFCSFPTFPKNAWCLTLVFSVLQSGCSDGAMPAGGGSGGVPAPTAGGGSTSNGATGGTSNEATGGSAAGGVLGEGGQGPDAVVLHPFGDVEVPGLDASRCAEPTPERTFALTTDLTFVQTGPFVTLTGTLPEDIDKSPIVRVLVNGSTRGVRTDPQRNTWSYFLLDPTRQFEIVAEAESGATLSIEANVATTTDALALRDVMDFHHTVGAFMVADFDGTTDRACDTAWGPAGGWESADGSIEWARRQLLDQLEAGIDIVGIRVEASESADPDAFHRVENVVRAAAQLIREGVHAPRLLPWLDVESIASRYEADQGSPLDLASDSGRAELYSHVAVFFALANAAFGTSAIETGLARFDGAPGVALGAPREVTDAHDAVAADLKARFVEEFEQACFLIADTAWGEGVAVDESTSIQGSAEHFQLVGHDGMNMPTIVLMPGAWDPLSENTYLPREGGTHYEAAWQSTLPERDNARHLWIDSWNDVERGTAVFASEPVSYLADDTGECGDFQYSHEDFWGEDGRHYIDLTRAGAAAWNNRGLWDAAPVVGDVPDRMRPGEQRYVTIAMLNTGDGTWTSTEHKAGVTFSSAYEGFRLDDLSSYQSDEVTERFGGVVRDAAGVFTVLLTAPCDEGSHLLSVEIYDAKVGGFGSHFRREIMVSSGGAE